MSFRFYNRDDLIFSLPFRKKEQLTNQYNDLQAKLKAASTKQTTIECQLQSFNTNRKNKMKTLQEEKQKLVDLDKVREIILSYRPLC